MSRTRRKLSRHRPCIEELERRDCPAAPVITLDVTMLSEQTIQLSGTVIDESPAAVTVEFSGVAGGTVSPDASGNYSFTTTATALGTVSAQALDAEGLLSSVAQDDVTSNAPQIANFTAAQVVGRRWSLAGQVVDESAAGLTVTFGGLASLAGKTAVVDSNGQFLLLADLAPGEGGFATAVTMDWWGLQSNLAQDSVQQAQAVSINATLTGDNHYGLYVGQANGGGLIFVGRNETTATGNPGAQNWSLPETFTFLAGDSDYLYVVAWDGQDQTTWPQAWIGQFEFPDQSLLLSDATNWEYLIAAGNNPSAPGGSGQLPGDQELAGEIAAATSLGEWERPQGVAPNGTSPWGTIPGISSQAAFLWGDGFASSVPSDEHYVIYRTRLPVTPLNHAPNAANDSASTSVNTALVIPVGDLLANDSDVDQDQLQVVEVSATSAAGGNVVLDQSNGEVIYTPPAHFAGTDSFTYIVRDAHGWTDQATVTISVELGAGQVRATLTADNHYGLYYGAGDGSQLTLVGRNETGFNGNPGSYNWSLPESFVFEPDTDDYIYVVAWDGTDSALYPQMWIGEFVSGSGSTLLSNLTDWEFIVGGTNPLLVNGSNQLPANSDLQTLISLGVWVDPLAAAPNGTTPWGTIASISASAEFIWHDTLNAVSASDDSYVIFRARMPSVSPLMSMTSPSEDVSSVNDPEIATTEVPNLDSVLAADLLAIEQGEPTVPVTFSPVAMLAPGDLANLELLMSDDDLDEVFTEPDSLGSSLNIDDLFASCVDDELDALLAS